MAWQYHPILIVFAVGGLVSLVVAGYCGRYVQQYGWSYLVAGLGLLGLNNAVWVFAATLKTASTDLTASLLFYKLEFLGFLPNTAVGIVVALAYLGKDRWLNTRTFAVLSVVPAVFIALVFLNPDNMMIVNPRLIPAQGILAFEHDFSPLFDVFLAYLYGTVLVAISILGWGLMTDRVPTYPSMAAIAALSIPFVTAVLKSAGVYPPGGTGINVTPAASAMGISMLAVAIIRYRVFELIPVGRDYAIESMADGYLLVGPNGRILDANPRASELLGKPSHPELKTQPVDEVIPGSDVLSGTPPVHLKTEDRVLEVRRSKVSRQHQEAGYVLLLHDVTEKREKKLELERTNERLDRFASVVTHDLRNPLNVAKGRLALAQEEIDNEHLPRAEATMDRMAELIDNTLTLARQGRVVDDTEPVELADHTERCWRNVETTGADLTIEDDVTMEADPERLRSLFENLFRNAVEHGGPDVTITVGVLPDGFYIEDDGPGIPENERESVFEPGYTSTDSGSGFGLTIVREIAQAHGWELSVNEGDDGGTRFVFRGVETD